MDTLLLEPLKYYKSAIVRHKEEATKRFDDMVNRSGVDVAKNRETVNRYNAKLKEIDKVNSKIKKFTLLFWLIIFACIGIGIAAVILFLNPPESIPLLIGLTAGGIILIAVAIILAAKKVRPIIKNAEKVKQRLEDEASTIRSEAETQMAPLNALFREADTLELIEITMPEIRFHKSYTPSHEQLLIEEYDYIDLTDDETSVTDTLSGTIFENPFLYERYIEHRMTMATYSASITIHWTERVRDSKGNTRTVHRSQVLTATVTKPKPSYSVVTHLGYGCHAASNLSFSRTESDTDELSEGALARRIKKGERKLQKQAKKSAKSGGSFQEMANSEFDVLFGAHNRNHEVEFRLMYTPLAQNNTVDLLRSKDGYGDDFDFIKQGKYNIIKTVHAQKWKMRTDVSLFRSFDIDTARNNYISYNEEYFKSIFFDFAPLLSIPSYHENTKKADKVQKCKSNFTQYEHEVLANAIGTHAFAHPDSATDSILKTLFLEKSGNRDRVRVTAHSYRAEPRIEPVSVFGRDGRFHIINVPWVEYIPLTASRNILLSASAFESSDAHLHGISAKLCD